MCSLTVRSCNRMKDYITIGLILVLCVLSCSQGQSDDNTTESAGVSRILTSVSVDSGDNSATDVGVSQPPHVQRVGVWRPARRGSNRRGYNDVQTDNNGRRQRRPHHRGRRPQRTNQGQRRRNPNRDRIRNSNVRNRADELGVQYGSRRLVATGSHSVSPNYSNRGQHSGVDPFAAIQNGQNSRNGQQRPSNSNRGQNSGVDAFAAIQNGQNSRNTQQSPTYSNRRQNSGVDPFAAIQNGQNSRNTQQSPTYSNRRQNSGVDPFAAIQNGQNSRNTQQSPFQDRRTAYDFLSNGGNTNRFRIRNENRRERREENARMAAVMCGVFGKQFVPSAIGGRCVDVD